MLTRLSGGCVVALACVLWAGECRAQLRFEKATVTVPYTGQETMVGEFPFEVGPAGQVVITKVVPDCSCTLGTLDKKTYEPGDKGRVKLEFKVGEAFGPQEKRLAITASDQEQPHLVTLLTELPTKFDFNPRTVYWEHAGPLTEKVVTFQVAAEQAALTSVRAESDQPTVSVTVKEIVPGKKFEFHLTPSVTDQVLVAKIRITTTDANKTDRTFFCFAMVKPAPTD